MKNISRNIVSYESFDPRQAKYQYKLSKITDKDILNKIKRLIDTISYYERCNFVTLLFRGVAKDKFFKQNDLFKHFVVGEKGKYYLKEQSDFIYTENFNDENTLKQDIEKMIKEINTIISERKKHPISGSIDTNILINKKNLSLEDLRYYKIFLSAVLHNIGNRWLHKGESPFISTTYGEGKFEVAKKFSKPYKEEQVSMIFVYYMLNSSRYYLLTNKLNGILKNLNVDWYNDIHSEMIILDGLLPHLNLGIIELNQDNRYNFILNPWLYFQFLNDIPFDLRNGIYIDQTDFEKFAKDLGYQKFYQQYPNGTRTYHSIDGKYYGRTGSFAKKKDNNYI